MISFLESQRVSLQGVDVVTDDHQLGAHFFQHGNGLAQKGGFVVQQGDGIDFDVIGAHCDLGLGFLADELEVHLVHAVQDFLVGRVQTVAYDRSHGLPLRVKWIRH